MATTCPTGDRSPDRNPSAGNASASQGYVHRASLGSEALGSEVANLKISVGSKVAALSFSIQTLKGELVQVRKKHKMAAQGHVFST
jgi:hypothetical protein